MWTYREFVEQRSLLRLPDANQLHRLPFSGAKVPVYICPPAPEKTFGEKLAYCSDPEQVRMVLAKEVLLDTDAALFDYLFNDKRK